MPLRTGPFKSLYSFLMMSFWLPKEEGMCRVSFYFCTKPILLQGSRSQMFCFSEKYLVEDISPNEDLAVTVEPIPEDAAIKRTEMKTKANPNDPTHIQPRIQPDRSISVRQSREVTVGKPRGRTRSRSGSSRHISSSAANESPQIVGFNFILTFQSTDFSFVDYHFMCDTL